MLKKLTLLVVSAAALVAFAVPTMASAEVGLTNASSEHVKVGELVTAVSTNTVTKSEAAVLECAEVGITGEVTENTPGVAIAVSEVTTSPICKVNGFELATIEASMEEIVLTTGGTGSAYGVTFTSIFDPPLTGGCHFSANPNPMAVSWNETSVSVGGGGNNLLSPTCGPAEISGSFSLTNHDHTETLTLD